MPSRSPIIALILSGLSITRWNTFPRIQTYTTLDHIAFTTHIALTLARLIGEKEGRIYNTGVIIREILCSGFFSYHYSDISSEVKYRLSENSPEIRHALHTNLVEEMSRLGLQERVIQDIERTYSESSSQERELIRFAKAWASYYEVASNSVVYPEAYTTLLASMRETIESPENSVFLTYLDLDMSHTHTQGQYLLTIHRLASSYRWNRMNRQYPISVLSHLTLVTYITYLLGIEAGESDATIDTMLEIALFHDIPEAITGDIITPTKKAIPGLEAAIEQIEADMVDEYLIAPISAYAFAAGFRQLMLHPWQGEHGATVKLADHISALLEADLERSHSLAFADAYDRIREKIEEYQDPRILAILGPL